LQNAQKGSLSTFQQTIKDKTDFWNSNPVGYDDKTDQLVNGLKSLNEQM